MIKVIAFYKFMSLSTLPEIVKKIKSLSETFPVSGTMILADEGINSTIAGYNKDIDGFMVELTTLFGELQPKYAFCENNPFHRFKIKHKQEIVTFEDKSVGPHKCVGTYTSPDKWNDLIQNEDVLLLDTRNDYETNIGYFIGAEIPNVHSFLEFKQYLDNVIATRQVDKIAMYCTGGIRCEKSTGYALKKGVKEVYHLEGGILNYFATIKKEDNLWQGECFVFDHRVSVDQNLNSGNYFLCHACGYPLSKTDTKHQQYEEGVSCHLCFDQMNETQKARFRERAKQIKLAEKQGRKHIGANMKALRTKDTANKEKNNVL